MKTINNYINEKLVVGKNIIHKHYGNDSVLYKNLLQLLQNWIMQKDQYKNEKNNRFEFLKYFDNKLLELLDYFQGTMENLSERLNVNINYLSNFIEKNNDELIDDLKYYYLDSYNKIPF